MDCFFQIVVKLFIDGNFNVYSVIFYGFEIILMFEFQIYIGTVVFKLIWMFTWFSNGIIVFLK